MMHRTGWLVVALCAIVSPSGCATHADRLRSARDEFYTGNLGQAKSLVDEKLKHARGDAEVLKLDRAMIELVAGRPQQAERLLREVRDRFDYLEQTSAAEHVLAAATDAQRISYAGEDYEKLLVRAMLALANLVGDGGDAGAYALQVVDKQQQIIEAGADDTGENPKLGYKRLALGSYIYGLLREETHSNYDDAERAYRQVVEWAPQFREGADDLARAQHGRHSAQGNGVLYVFTLVGRGPYKEQVSEIPTTAALLIADRIVSHTAGHTLPPTIAPIKVPKVVQSRNKVSAVEVTVDNAAHGTTEVLTDVGRLAVAQYEAVYPRIMAQAIARRVIKKGVVYATKEAMHDESPLVNLALDAGGVVWEATEAADTRCWGLLPETIQVLRVELPAGTHRIGLRAVCGAHGCGSVKYQTVRISEGRNTYVLGNFPTSELVGTILTNQAVGE